MVTNLRMGLVLAVALFMQSVGCGKPETPQALVQPGVRTGAGLARAHILPRERRARAGDGYQN